MSYCRKNAESDVYMYPTDDVGKGFIICHECINEPKQVDVWLSSPRTALWHLQDHIKAGHKVPQGAVERLKREASNQK